MLTIIIVPYFLSIRLSEEPVAIPMTQEWYVKASLWGKKFSSLCVVGFTHIIHNTSVFSVIDQTRRR